MKIYGMGASRSFRAVWAAEEAALNYEYIELSFGKDGGTDGNKDNNNNTASPEYRLKNSQGKFPTIEHQGQVITESGAIVNYMAHLSEKPLRPSESSIERAKYDELCFFVLTELEQPLWSKGKHSFALPEKNRIPELIEKTLPFEFEKAQRALLKLKGNSEYAAGEYFTMADILLAHTISWAMSFKFEVDESLAQYRERMYQREACLKARALVSHKKIK